MDNTNNYDYRTLEEIVTAFENENERVLLHNGHLVGFEHQEAL